MENQIIYSPGTDHKQTIDAIMAVAKAIEGGSRKRILYRNDANDLLNLIDSRPDAKTARSYSADGFVANAYKYPSYISRCNGTRNSNGTWTITVERATATRSYGSGALLTVDNRAV